MCTCVSVCTCVCVVYMCVCTPKEKNVFPTFCFEKPYECQMIFLIAVCSEIALLNSVLCSLQYIT